MLAKCVNQDKYRKFHFPVYLDHLQRPSLFRGTLNLLGFTLWLVCVLMYVLLVNGTRYAEVYLIFKLIITNTKTRGGQALMRNK